MSICNRSHRITTKGFFRLVREWNRRSDQRNRWRQSRHRFRRSIHADAEEREEGLDGPHERIKRSSHGWGYRERILHDAKDVISELQSLRIKTPRVDCHESACPLQIP